MKSIFGPTKDWECSLRKIQKVSSIKVLSVTAVVLKSRSLRVRRERMGHIDLAVPVVTHLVLQMSCRAAYRKLVLDMTGPVLLNACDLL